MRLRGLRKISTPTAIGWAKRAAERDVRNLRRQSLGDRIRGLDNTRTSIVVLVIATAQVGVLALAALAHAHEVSVWRSLAPRDPQAVLAVLWQVEAAVVGLGFAFVILLIQFSGERALAAKSASEVLARHAHVRPIFVFGATGLLTTGIVNAWVPGDAELALVFALVFAPTLLFLIWCYTRALDVLLDVVAMRRLSIELVVQKLRASMRQVAVTRRANSLVIQALLDSDLDARYAPAEFPGQVSTWAVLPARAGGLVVDIHAGRLVRALLSLPLVTGPASESPEDEGQPVNVDYRPVIRVRRMIGDSVERGEALVAIDLASSAPPLPMGLLDGVFRIEGQR